jgi:molybdate transport system substrate-binding protein
MIQLVGISSMATRHVLADLAKNCQPRNGCSVTFTSIGGVEAERRLRAGEEVDIVILASKAMERLEVEGHIMSGSRVNFAGSGMAVAVRSGAERPSIRDEASVKEAMLSAQGLCYSTGPSGDHLRKLWERWGITDRISQRAIQAPPGVPVGTIVGRGEADLGFQQLSELLHLPNIDVLGPLPPEIQLTTIFTAGIGSASKQPEPARELIAYLTSPETEATKRKHGMVPA